MSGNKRLDQFLKFKPADFAPNQPGYKACQKFFKDFDTDNSGFVELDEICKAFDMCEAHAKVVIEEFDDDGNNKLDFDEFLCLFASQVCYKKSGKKCSKKFRTLAIKFLWPSVSHFR